MEIPISPPGEVALIDERDFNEVDIFNWRMIQPNRRGRAKYARCSWQLGGRTYAPYMHDLIMKPPPGYEVDHINGNGLDNRRCNLRLATRSQNARNSQGHRDGTSSFRGVCRWASRVGSDRPWQACLGRRHLGFFATEEDAAKAYDAAALEEYGEFARPNLGSNHAG